MFSRLITVVHEYFVDLRQSETSEADRKEAHVEQYLGTSMKVWWDGAADTNGRHSSLSVLTLAKSKPKILLRWIASDYVEHAVVIIYLALT